MTQTSILNDLKDHTVAYLTEQLITNVAADDMPAGLIRAGKLQADPTLTRINVLIQNGDDSWQHTRCPKDHPALAGIGTAFEIGGPVGQFWLRRFVAKLTFFFNGVDDRDVVIEDANKVLSRTEAALLDMPMPGTTDSFGEAALAVYVDTSYLREGGGPPSDFNHRGEIRFEFLTERVR